MTTDQLADFCAQKQQEIASLTKEQDAAKKVLFARMVEAKQEEVVTPFGRFYQVPRTSYIFPEDVIAIKNQLIQAEEQAKAEDRVKTETTYYYKYGTVKVDL